MAHSFKLSKNLDSKKNKKMDYSLILMIAFILIAILSMVICFIMLNKKEEVIYIDKKNAKKDYVYTIKKDINQTADGITNEIPTININNSKIETINNKILTNYNNVSSLPDEYEYGYEYSVNDKKHILSLIVKYSYIPEKVNKMVTYFDTYNIDLLTGDIISDDDLLKRYDIKKDKLSEFIGAKFENYYREIVKKKYYTKEECDYACFLKNRGLTDDYLKGVSLYVKDNSLVMYKFYFMVSKYHEEEYFADTSYDIVVKEEK